MLSIAWVIILGTIGVLAVVIMLSDYRYIDEDHMRNNLARVTLALQERTGAIDTLTKDWAHWDATYYFMKTKNAEYIKENLANATFINAGLDFIIFYDTHGKLYMGNYFDYKNQKRLTEVPATILAAIHANPRLTSLKEGSAHIQGFLRDGNCFLAFSAAPITTSQMQGPIRGTIIMGRMFDERQVSELSKITKFPVSIYPLKPIKELNDKLYFVQFKTQKIMTGYTYIRDINNNPIAIIELNLSRDIYAQGEKTILFFMLTLVGVGLLLGLLLWVFLKHLVLDRILSLSKQVEDVGESKKFDTTTSVSGSDEVNLISTTINHLFKVIQENEHELTDRLESMKRMNVQLKSEIKNRLSVESKLKLQQKQLDYMAHHDVLTGLPNRVLFYENLGRVILEAKKLHKKIAIFFIDLDGFKELNDILGHKYGDIYLKQIAVALEKVVGKNEFISRLGGDEFVIYSVEVDGCFNPEVLAKNIIHAISQLRPDKKVQVELTASVGVSLYPDHAVTVNDLQRMADLAMYYAKSQGKNTFFIYNENIEKVAVKRVELEASIQEGLKRNQFIPFYQPIINLKTGKIVSVEALVYWCHPTQGFLKPPAFIHVVENSILIHDLTTAVVTQCCEDIYRWKKEGLLLERCNINISTRSFSNSVFVDFLLEKIKSNGIDYSDITLEITETSVIENVSTMVKRLSDLREKRIKIAIDDFGTGYSSLLMLKFLPIDILKIDCQFVETLGSDKENEVFVKNIISLAHGLNIVVVAEGVENERQEAMLKTLDCDFVQGYYYSVPLSSEDLIKFVKNHAAKNQV